MLDIISDAMFIICAPMAVICFALILRVLKQIRNILSEIDYWWEERGM